MQAYVQPAVQRPVARSFALAPAATTWFKLSVVYLLVGVSLGIAMGASGSFTLRPVHAHINLLGFTVMTLAGLIYSVYPAAGASRLAAIHFWLHNISLPVMMGSLAALLLGNASVVPVLGVSEVLALVGVIAFVANVFINVKPAARAPLR
jgi:hypothetical protein